MSEQTWRERAANATLRIKSCNGVPVEKSQFLRKCQQCGASFRRLAPGITGQYGLWRDWRWFCSQECYGKDGGEGSPVVLTQYVRDALDGGEPDE